MAAPEVSELIVVGGERFQVQGTLEEVEAMVLNAARGSILELVWLTEAETGHQIALNPAHIVALRDRRSHERLSPGSS